jgi:hypothetical protein
MVGIGFTHLTLQELLECSGVVLIFNDVRFLSILTYNRAQDLEILVFELEEIVDCVTGGHCRAGIY